MSRDYTRIVDPYLHSHRLSVDDLHPTALQIVAEHATVTGLTELNWILRSILGKTSQQYLTDDETALFLLGGRIALSTILYQCVLRPGDLNHSERLKKDLPIRAVNQPFTPLIGSAIVTKMLHDLYRDFHLKEIVKVYQQRGQKLSVVGKGHGGLILGMLVAEALNLPFLPLTKAPFDFQLTGIGNQVWIHPAEPHLPKGSPILYSNMLVEPNTGVIIIDDEATSGSVHYNTIVELRGHGVTTELVAVLLKASDRARAKMEELDVRFYFMAETETKDDDPAPQPRWIPFQTLTIPEHPVTAPATPALRPRFVTYPRSDGRGLFMDYPLRGMTLPLHPEEYRSAKTLAHDHLSRMIDLPTIRREFSRKKRSVFVVGTTPSGLHLALAVSHVTGLPLLSTSTRPEPVGFPETINYVGLNGYTYSVFGLTPGDAVILVTGELTDAEEQRRIVKALHDNDIAIIAHLGAIENTGYDGRAVLRNLHVPTSSLFEQRYQEGLPFLNASRSARDTLVYGLDNLSRRIRHFNPTACIAQVLALPSSFTRGVMMRDSDMDEVFVLVKGISQSQLNQLAPCFYRWIERPEVTYSDDHSNPPMLVSSESSDKQLEKYCIPELPLINLMADRLIKPMATIGAESNRAISMFIYEKTIARLKLLLYWNDIDEDFVRSLLEVEDPTATEYEQLSVFLARYRNAPLPPSAQRLILELDQAYSSRRYSLDVSNVDEFLEGMRFLRQENLIRIYGTQILPIWRMHSGRVSPRFWERQIRIGCERDPEWLSGEMAETERHLSSYRRSDQPRLTEDALRSLLDGDQYALSRIGTDSILRTFDESPTLCCVTASELMVANPVQFMDPICQSLLRRTPLNVRTGFTYRQRLALSWLVTTMMRIGHTSAPHADRVGQFVLDHFLADQEDNPQTLPQLVMQNVIENLPMLVPMIRNGDLVRKLDRSVDALCRANFPRISEKAKMAKTRMVRAFHARGSSNK